MVQQDPLSGGGTRGGVWGNKTIGEYHIISTVAVTMWFRNNHVEVMHACKHLLRLTFVRQVLAHSNSNVSFEQGE